MVRLLIAMAMLVSAQSFAQVSATPQDEKKFTLQQRYWSMKSKAETYLDYKVVKEYVLDGVWKVMMDSVKGQKLLVTQGRQTIAKLEGELHAAKLTLANERKAAAQSVYDSAHISVLGIDFKKRVFIILIMAIISTLVFIGSAMVTRIKLLQSHAKEKVVISELITRELDEFKKKAMDKQIKLARELQDERNKLADLKQRLAH